MRSETQLALIDRINVHREAGRGTDTAPASLRVPTTEYTDPDRLERERKLTHTVPNLVGLSGLLPEANTFATVEVGDRSVVLTRDGDGSLHAMLNVCSHRGAEVASGCGSAARLSCPYHGWTYHLDGALAAKRRGEFFDDDDSAGLTPVPVAECDGMIWVTADASADRSADSSATSSATSADPSAGTPSGSHPAGGAEDELAPLDLAEYRLFGTRRFARDINWKLAVDTFMEAYHVAVLHTETIHPLFYSDFALFDAFGAHGRMVSTRRSIDQLSDVERTAWELLPHATVLYYFQPNTVLIHQQDHVQMYRANPGPTPDSCELFVSLYVPPDSERSDRHWQRNLDLLVDVTDSEDFETCAGIQRGFASGAHDSIVFGRNEPALQHFHRSLDELLARACDD